MRVACVSEGETEYICVPKIVGRLGHVVVSNVHVGGCADDWNQVFEVQMLPFIKTAALKNPDKILIVVDREARVDCTPTLAAKAIQIVSAGLQAAKLNIPFTIVISDRQFEVLVMADYDLVDKLDILRQPVAPHFGDCLDGINPKAIIDSLLKPGRKYHKVKHGGALASKMRLADQTVLARSRSLRKIVKELK
jgi:hypothetical protein